MDNGLKKSSVKYFDDNASRYANDYYLERKERFMWLRHRAILDMIDFANLKQDSKILDIGCGPGELVFDLHKKGLKGVGMDLAPQMIDLCNKRMSREKNKENWSFIVGDAEKTGFESSEFDLIIASGVIEYLPHDQPMLKEMHRLLKSGGKLILNVTNQFGYTTCLNSFTKYLKQFPVLNRVGSRLRKAALNSQYGVKILDFTPRKHIPRCFLRNCSNSNFRIVGDKYLGFSLFPSPISTLLTKFTCKIDDKLECLDGTFLRKIGSSYLVLIEKE